MKMDWRGDKVIRAAEQAKKKALTEAALVVEGLAIELAPSPGETGYGNLKNSLTHQVKGDEARVGTNVVYAARLEFGFRDTDSLGRRYNQAPRPYLRPAFDKSKKEVEKILGDVIGKDIEGGG